MFVGAVRGRENAAAEQQLKDLDRPKSSVLQINLKFRMLGFRNQKRTIQFCFTPPALLIGSYFQKHSPWVGGRIISARE